MQDAATIAAKWSTGLQNATQKITDGVNAVQTAPGAKAAAQKAVYVANVVANQDKWARKVGAVSLPSWKDSMITKGIPRIGQGATAAQPKFANFMTQLLPAIQSSVNSLPPRGGLDANIARMTQHVRTMAKFQYAPQS